MSTPNKIYLHETIDAESGQHLGYEWHPQQVREDDVCYYSEEYVTEMFDDMFEVFPYLKNKPHEQIK